MRRWKGWAEKLRVLALCLCRGTGEGQVQLEKERGVNNKWFDTSCWSVCVWVWVWVWVVARKK